MMRSGGNTFHAVLQKEHRKLRTDTEAHTCMAPTTNEYPYPFRCSSSLLIFTKLFLSLDF